MRQRIAYKLIHAGHFKSAQKTMDLVVEFAATLEPNQIVSGAPIMPHETWMKAQAVIPRLPELRHLVRNLEQRMEAIESRIKSKAAPKGKRSKRGRA